MHIPEDLQKRYGLAPMGAADGPVKRAILGENNARLYGVSPAKRAAIATDKVARCKQVYDRRGGDRTNLAYGYILKKG